MSEIPHELQRLWAERDRTKKTVPRETPHVLMDLRDDDPLLNGNGESGDDASSVPDDQPVPVPIEPIRDVQLFPTYRIGPRPVNLATFDHVKRKRE